MPVGAPRADGVTGPVRTCVGCRQRCPATALLRVVAGDGRLVPDPRGRLPGRGAWVHPDQACLERAEQRRAFGRALRLTGPADSSTVRDWVTRSGPLVRRVTSPRRDPWPDRKQDEPT